MYRLCNQQTAERHYLIYVQLLWFSPYSMLFFVPAMDRMIGQKYVYTHREAMAESFI